MGTQHIAARLRAVGLVLTFDSRHSPSFHSRVACENFVPAATPPNRTSTPRAGSHADCVVTLSSACLSAALARVAGAPSPSVMLLSGPTHRKSPERATHCCLDVLSSWTTKAPVVLRATPRSPSAKTPALPQTSWDRGPRSTPATGENGTSKSVTGEAMPSLRATMAVLPTRRSGPCSPQA